MYPSQLPFLTGFLHPLLLHFTFLGSTTVGKRGEFWTWALDVVGQWIWLQVKEFNFKCILHSLLGE